MQINTKQIGKHLPYERSPGRPNYSSYEDKELWSLFLKGDERAFEVVVKRYELDLQRYFVSALGDFQQAEDLAQDTFLKICRYKNNYEFSKDFHTWVFVVASRILRNHLRYLRFRKTQILVSSLNHEVDCQNWMQYSDPVFRDPLEESHFSLAMEDFETAVYSLTPRQQQVVRLRYLEDLEYHQIIRRLGIPKGVVGTHLYDAHCILARLLFHLRDQDA